MQTEELEHILQSEILTLQRTHFRFPDVESVHVDAAILIKIIIKKQLILITIRVSRTCSDASSKITLKIFTITTFRTNRGT